MKSEITKIDSHPSRVLVEEWMSRRVEVADWNFIIKSIEIGKITSESVVEELKTYEPLPAVISFHVDHQIWILQQKLRIALRKEKGKPLHTNLRCPECGRADRFEDGSSDWSDSCVACSEEALYFQHTGSRGSCWFMKTALDVVSRTWGILSYTAFYDDMRDELMFFPVIGYANRQEANQAMLPWCSAYTWQWSFRTSMPIGRQQFPWHKASKKALPMTPEMFREFTREELIELADSDAPTWI